MGLRVTFTPSQLSSPGGTSPINFRSPPFGLFLSDLKMVARLILHGYLPTIIFPLRTTNPLGELYPWSGGNIMSMVLHFFLFWCSVIGIFIGPVVFLLMPGIGGVFFAAIVTANCFIWIWCLNRGPQIVNSTAQLPKQDRFKHEKWFFINGVMVGNHWLLSAVNEVAILFGRDVVGIRNKTWGLVFDVLECLVQRDMGYCTRDVRGAYTNIKAALMDDGLQKVILVVHSQGAIVMSMAMDQLLADLPREYFKKMEIYTFGCAANHFNNPKHMKAGPNDKAVIRYIEHYVNTYDFVSNWGILEFVTPVAEGQGPLNRFAGRLFERHNIGGHMFVQHYLTNMFGANKEEFLSTIMDDDSGNRQGSRPDTTEAPKRILENAEGRKTMREVSRLAHYLDGNSPPDPPPLRT